MSSSESSATPIEPPAQESTAQEERQEWVFRAIAGTATILLLWLAYRARNNGVLSLLIAPLIVGAAIATLRLPAVSGRVNSIDNWFRQCGGATGKICAIPSATILCNMPGHLALDGCNHRSTPPCRCSPRRHDPLLCDRHHITHHGRIHIDRHRCGSCRFGALPMDIRDVGWQRFVGK